MVRDSLPPLLRGIGMTVILLATVIAFLVARHDTDIRRQARPPVSAENKVRPSVDSLSNDIQELRLEVEDETVVEEIIENPWFDLAGFVGTAIVISSFYTEWMVRRAKKG